MGKECVRCSHALPGKRGGSLYFRAEFRYLGSENLKSMKVCAGIFEKIRKRLEGTAGRPEKSRQPLRGDNQNEVRERRFYGIIPFSLQKKVAQRERLGVKSSVDVDDFARDVGGIVGGEEGSEGSNFVGCAEAAERN